MRLMLSHRKQYYRNVIIYKSYAKRFVVNQILIVMLSSLSKCNVKNHHYGES